MDYTRITALIGGCIGLHTVDCGNLVRAANSNDLGVITQTQPIAMVFDIPDDGLPRVRERLRKASLPVTAFNRDQSTTLGQGQLTAIDNRINATTGMVRLKAQFPNRDERLFPNQFVNARLLLEVARNSRVIPDAAIQRGAAEPYVWVVGPDQKVTARPIQTATRDRGLTAITAGLQIGERVVIDGTERLAEGEAVEIIKTSQPADEASQSP
ncbi:MAG: efflux RND transporter periplasmic adaptor subunit [Pseudomonadota bacterium]|nr:efflux RND transporter periplasmic adaptor subunit [Pseudomonadota bacterium]